MQYRDQNNATWVNFDDLGLASNDLWQLGTEGIAPYNLTLDVYFGGVATASAQARVQANGEIFVTPTSALTTAIDLTDTDLTNALSIADNNIIGSTAAIDFDNFDVATTGHITVDPAYGLDVNAAGELKLGDTTATTVSLGTTAATTINIGAGGALTRAIDIGTGTGADTINIGTGATGADVITVGGGVGTLAINSGDWDISTTGDMTGIGGITADGAITFTPSTTNGITFNLDTDSLFTLDSAVTDADTFILSPNNTGTGTTNIGTLTTANLTGTQTWTLPDATGVVCLDSNNCGFAAGTNYWQLGTEGIAPYNLTLDVYFGGVATASAQARVQANGEIFVTPTSALTTAIDLTDTDLTNALSIADNNIIGSTAAIDFDNFDVATTGHITVDPAYGLDVNAAGELKLGDTTATTVSLGTTAATTINIGAGGALNRAIDIGTG